MQLYRVGAKTDGGVRVERSGGVEVAGKFVGVNVELGLERQVAVGDGLVLVAPDVVDAGRWEGK